MRKESLVIIGNGMASARFVDELAKVAPERYDVCIIGEEPRLAYNRVLLSSVLAGEIDTADIELKPAQWWRDHGVDMRCGCKATAIDTSGRSVLLANGERIRFSKLVLATGSQALRLPINGAELGGVYSFRDVTDAEALAKLGESRKKVLVIGGGLLGLEAAYGLAKRGADVTLAHLMDRLMERQLDAAGAMLLKRLVEEKGVRVLLNASAAQIDGRDTVERVAFHDGSTISVDAVVFAVGVKPNAELAREAGLATNRGLIVDDCLATSVEGIYALGECAEHRGVCYGLVEPAYEQARVLAARLGGADTVYAGSVVSTNLKVSGVHVFSAGDFIGATAAQHILCSDAKSGIYKKLVIENDRLVGAILIGDTSGALSRLDLIRSGADVNAIRDELMFGDPARLKEAA